MHPARGLIILFVHVCQAGHSHLVLCETLMLCLQLDGPRVSGEAPLLQSYKIPALGHVPLFVPRNTMTL